MNEEDMIGLPDETSTSDNASSTTDNQPAVPGEIEGALLDNDEVNDETAQASGDETLEDAGEASGDEGNAGDETPSVESTPPRPAEDQPVAQSVADPGTEFIPQNDYSFDIELADGQKIHISKPEDIDQIPQDADFGSPANLMKAQAAMNKMVIGIDQEQREWEANKQKFEAQQAKTAATEERVKTMIAEVDYLQAKGRLPAVDPKYENADWTDPEVQKQPGVKERLELLNYRAEENKARAAAGLPPMSLIEAMTQRDLENYQTRQDEHKNKNAQLRKARGAMVGGGSASAMNSIPDDIIVGDGGRINDIR